MGGQNMDRRTFLGLGFGLLGNCGFGSVVTNMVGRMPPRTQVVVQPWNEGRLRVASFTVKVGAAKPFRTVHFSDTHINLSDIEEMYASDDNYKAGSAAMRAFPRRFRASMRRWTLRRRRRRRSSSTRAISSTSARGPAMTSSDTT